MGVGACLFGTRLQGTWFCATWPSLRLAAKAIGAKRCLGFWSSFRALRHHRLQCPVPIITLDNLWICMFLVQYMCACVCFCLVGLLLWLMPMCTVYVIWRWPEEVLISSQVALSFLSFFQCHWLEHTHNTTCFPCVCTDTCHQPWLSQKGTCVPTFFLFLAGNEQVASLLIVAHWGRFVGKDHWGWVATHRGASFEFRTSGGS